MKKWIKEGSQQDIFKKDGQLKSSSRNINCHQDKKEKKPINKKNIQHYNCQWYGNFVYEYKLKHIPKGKGSVDNEANMA